MTSLRMLTALLTFAAGAAWAGTAEVKFIQPGRFSDLATNRWEEQDNMRTLANYIQRLAQQLPADQVLRVEVLDVDLAGEPRDTRHGRIRVMRSVDLPRIALRYTLESHDRTIRSGQENLTDLNFAFHLAHYEATTPLYYEKNLLANWFHRDLAPQVQAYAH